MDNHKKRALAGFSGFILLFVAIIIATWKYTGISTSVDKLIKDIKTKELISPNDNQQIKIGYDSYLGYSIISSRKFKREIESQNIEAKLVDDGANYPDRFSKLIKGDLDLAIMPIHDYLEQLQLSQTDQKDMPLIIAAISESKGSDAVVSNPDIFPNINQLKKMKQLKAAYTSPFMLKSMAIDAHIPVLLEQRNIQANDDIEDTYNGLITGKYDIAGLWEPYITKAKEKGFVVLMGSDELKLGKIVDVLVANRSFIANYKKDINRFLKHYFKTVDFFKNNRSELINDIEIKQAGELNKIDIVSSLKTIKFYNLADNAYNLFHIHSNSNEKIIDYIDAISIKLKKMGILSANSAIYGDSKKIIYDNILRDIYNSYESGTIPVPKKDEKIYKHLSDQSWNKLIKDPKFTRDDLTITFLRDGQLNNIAKQTLDNFAQNSINNFDYYIAIVGKSAKVKGLSQEELQQRTEKKAQKVYDYLTKYWSIDKNRLKPIGVGSKGVKVKKDSENYYKYLNENNRVDLLFIDY